MYVGSIKKLRTRKWNFNSSIDRSRGRSVVGRELKRSRKGGNEWLKGWEICELGRVKKSHRRSRSRLCWGKGADNFYELYERELAKNARNGFKYGCEKKGRTHWRPIL